MGLFRKEKKPESTAQAVSVPQTMDRYANMTQYFSGELFENLRKNVPIIDAAIERLIRLIGEFTVKTDDINTDRMLENLFDTINIGGTSCGINSFTTQYLDRLLTYGTAICEIVPTTDYKNIALYIANPRSVTLKRNKQKPLNIDIYSRDTGGEKRVKNPNLIRISTLNPKPDSLYGTSILEGLPFVSSILVNIFDAVGKNWERAGNIRYSVNYKPQDDAMDNQKAREKAQQIATSWADAMGSHEVKDFVSVGNIEIKVIGSDSKILDSEVPVRQCLEQIIAKIGIPPFLLGLSWSATERMATMQADLLTSEIEAYRRILTPVIIHIAKTFLRMRGFERDIKLNWNDITNLDAQGGLNEQ